MEAKYLQEFNEFLKSYHSPFDVISDFSVKGILVNHLANLDNSHQMDLFGSSEDRVSRDLEELESLRGKALYMQWSQETNGKTRNLAVPARVLQRFISQYFVPMIKRVSTHSCCHGAEYGWSPKRSLETHLPLECTLTFDLTNAFGNYTVLNIFDLFYENFRELDKEKRIALAGFFAMIGSVLDSDRRVLPQGAPHSSYVFNRGLYEIDEHLTEKSRVRGFYYTRWTDDFTISSRNRQPVENFLGAVEFVSRYFPISPKKIFFQEIPRRIYLLGHVISGNRISKNTKEDREKNKASPLEYNEWFSGERRYDSWL